MIRGEGTVFSSVLPVAILQTQSAWLSTVTPEGEFDHTSNSMYFNARVFYQQRNRGERTADGLFLPFPCDMKGDSSEDGTAANAVLGTEVEARNPWIDLEARRWISVQPLQRSTEDLQAVYALAETSTRQAFIL